MAAILNSAILNSTILYSGILHNNSLTHSFSFNLMMGAILNLSSLIQPFYTCWIQTLPSWIQTPWLSSLRFTQKHSHSTLTLTQTNSIWFKLIHSHLTWWWQPSWILQSWIWPSWIQPSNIFLSNSLTFAKIGPHHLHKKTSFILTQLDGGSHIERVRHVILDSDTLLSSLRFTQKHFHSTLTLTQTNSIWLNLIHS